MTRPRLIVLSVIGILMLYAVGTWISNRTEWIEYTMPMPPKGEAARNPFYASQRFAEKLGADTSWDRIFVEPSTDAVVVLSTWQWSLSANRRLALQRWVENGGRLIVDRGIWGGVDEFERWSGIVWHESEEDEDSEEDEGEAVEPGSAGAGSKAPGSEASGSEAAGAEAAGSPEASGEEAGTGGAGAEGAAAEAAAAQGAATESAGTEDAQPADDKGAEAAGGEDDGDESGDEDIPWVPKCEDVTEQRNGVPAGPASSHRVMCSLAQGVVLQAKTPPEWALQDEKGRMHAVRMRVGRGSVTVINSMPFRGRNLFLGDHGWLLVNATQMKRGDEIHFLSEDEYPGLLALAWIRGWPVIVLSGIVVALLLWRGAVRFGPLIAAPAQARRSLAEQIRGTGEFVLRGGGEAALHAAMVRALEETLRKRVKGFSGMSPGKARRDALAVAIGDRTRAASLEEAMYGADVAHGTVLRRTLARIEAARRHIISDDRKPKQRG